MFNFFKGESQKIQDLIKHLNLPEDIFFGDGEIVYKVKAKSIIEKVIDSDLKSLVADVVLELISEKNSELGMQPKIKKYYQRKIQEGTFNIWNNAIYYYGMSSNQFLKVEIDYYLIDQFISKFNNFSRMSISSIKDFINKKINSDELEMFFIDDNYYRTEFFREILDNTVVMLDNISSKINKELVYSNNYDDYDVSKNMKENLENKIENLSEILNSIQNTHYKIEHNGSINKYLLSTCFDFNSINCNSIFLNIKGINDSFWVELILSEKSPIILLYNYKESREGTEDEYNTLFNLLQPFITKDEMNRF